MTFCAIDDKKEQNLMVIWDLGRRCTYSCSYCPPHRKNNWSKVADIEELKATADNLERYSQVYNRYRSRPFVVNCSFSGGEPTVNPAFFDFLEYLQDRYPHWNRTLTTNGFYSERKLRLVMRTTNFSTVSYHCEGTAAQKAQVKKNIEIMNQEGYGFKVNVMFHADPDYFQECVDLCAWLDSIGASYIPRVIGDQGDIEEGVKNNTVHHYTKEQMSWFDQYWSSKKPKKTVIPINVSQMLTTEKVVGQTMGRPCCGGREMSLLDKGSWSPSKFVETNNFQGWNCMVNWYFLYIHQEINQIWHHQTCQVDLNGQVGPISTVNNFNEFIDRLDLQMAQGSVPFIKCPKTYCGCGLCVPKAESEDIAGLLFDSHTKNLDPEFMPMSANPGNQTLKTLVYRFDAANGNKTI